RPSSANPLGERSRARAAAHLAPLAGRGRPPQRGGRGRGSLPAPSLWRITPTRSLRSRSLPASGAGRRRAARLPRQPRRARSAGGLVIVNQPDGPWTFWTIGFHLANSSLRYWSERSGP